MTEKTKIYYDETEHTLIVSPPSFYNALDYLKYDIGANINPVDAPKPKLGFDMYLVYLKSTEITILTSNEVAIAGSSMCRRVVLSDSVCCKLNISKEGIKIIKDTVYKLGTMWRISIDYLIIGWAHKVTPEVRYEMFMKYISEVGNG